MTDIGGSFKIAYSATWRVKTCKKLTVYKYGYAML